jgi:hypothetical protein
MIEPSNNPYTTFSHFARDWILHLYESKFEHAIEMLDEPNTLGYWPTVEDLKEAASLLPRTRTLRSLTQAVKPPLYVVPWFKYAEDFSESGGGETFTLRYVLPGPRPSRQLIIEFVFRKRTDEFAVSLERLGA